MPLPIELEPIEPINPHVLHLINLLYRIEFRVEQGSGMGKRKANRILSLAGQLGLEEYEGLPEEVRALISKAGRRVRPLRYVA